MPRLLSIDVFRGLTVAVMILVNCIDTSQAHPWLVHSAWNGCTLADLVFPFFIFIVGVSAVFSITALKAKGYDQRAILVKIIKRTIFLFGVGFLINAYPNHLDFQNVRFLGVLQRIAICYGLTSILFLTTSIRTQIYAMITLLVGYWLAMMLIPVPGFGAYDLSAKGNLAAFIDRILIPANHLYQRDFDPEGLFSTLPALATALMGNLLGVWLLKIKQQKNILTGVTLTGFVLMGCGWLWGLTFPINKTIWSSSYVLWTGGIALLTYAFCYWLIEMRAWRAWSKAFELFGINAMSAFVLHVLFLKTQAKISVHLLDGTSISLNQLLTRQFFPHASLQQATLFYALCSVLFWLITVVLIQRGQRYFKHRSKMSKMC